MKNLIKFFALIAIVISSCTVQKRLHNDGYHISWKGVNRSGETEKKINEKVISREENVEVASVVSGNIVIENESQNSDIIIETDVVAQNNVKNNEVEEVTGNTHESVSSSVTKKELRESIKKAKKEQKKAIKKKGRDTDSMLILLVLLCFLIPPIAVGLKTNWDLTKLLISIILTLLFLVPGVIYALLVVFDVI